MPIEIRELIVRADVREQNPRAVHSSPQRESGMNKEAIVTEAVDRVLEILKRQKER